MSVPRQFNPPFRWALRILSTSLVLIGARPASAQRLYRLELSGGPSYHKFDNATALKSSIGGTLRLGYWIIGPLSAELEGSLAKPSTNTPLNATVTVRTVAASVLGNLMIGKYSSAYIKAGYASVSYGTCPSVSVPGSGPCGSAGAIQGGGGFRIALSPTVMLRTEGLISRSQTSLKFSNFVLGVGASVMVGSQPLVDSDGDGVYDRYDKCANTPAGAIVDKRGCATDTDHDGVYDGLDRCPDTPAGATVDKVGCPMDTDSDGVLDGIDKCPNTPKGAAVDEAGCPKDIDGDGVPDGLDRCPNTPRGATVDNLGCPSDSDNDGVPDGIDRCPNTPPGTPVNLFGCPLSLDSDHDGVPDALDRCPGTPPGTKVDVNGCPLVPGAPVPKEKAAPLPQAVIPAAPPPTVSAPTPTARPAVPKADTVTGSSVRSWNLLGSAFAPRSGKLLPAASPVLDSVVTMLLSNPFLKVEIRGLVRGPSAPSGDQHLSTQRAGAVRDYIESKGVPANRLQTKGSFPTGLSTADTSANARDLNTGVEIRPISPR